jgi:hypothetical protein
MRRVLIGALGLLLTACAATRAPVTAEEQAAIREAAAACRRDDTVGPVDYEIDRFGQVIVTTRAGQAAAQGQANRLAACIRAKRQGTQIAPVPSVAPATGSVSAGRTADRLKELEGLRQQRLISEEEYQATRKRILEGL